MTQSNAELQGASTEPLTGPATAPLPPTRKGPLALLGGLIVKPRATFAYLRDHGGSAWVWPLALALLTVFAARLVAVPIERAQAQAALQALQEQLEGQLPPGGEGDNVVTFGSGVPVGGPVFSAGPAGTGAASMALTDYGLPLLGVLGQWALAALVLLILAWVLGGRPRPGAIVRMAAWAQLVPLTARALVGIALMLATGRVPMPGLASLPSTGGPVITTANGETAAPEAETDAGMVMIGPGGAAGQFSPGRMFVDALRANFLSGLDLYTLWALALLIVGVAVTARLGWLKSTLATAGYWSLSLAAAALPPVLSFWMMSLTGAAGFMPMP